MSAAETALVAPNAPCLRPHRQINGALCASVPTLRRALRWRFSGAERLSELGSTTLPTAKSRSSMETALHSTGGSFLFRAAALRISTRRRAYAYRPERLRRRRRAHDRLWVFKKARFAPLLGFQTSQAGSRRTGVRAGCATESGIHAARAFSCFKRAPTGARPPVTPIVHVRELSFQLDGLPPSVPNAHIFCSKARPLVTRRPIGGHG